jgi:hypothetical protein
MATAACEAATLSSDDDQLSMVESPGGGRGGISSLINKTMALLERDVFLVIGVPAGLGSALLASGGGGGRGMAPFLCVAPLSYPQPGL